MSNAEPTFHPSYLDLLATLARLYPQTTQRLDLKTALSPLLVSPLRVTLKRELLLQAERIAAAFFALRNVAARTERLSALAPPIADPGNTSVLMSYDFHIDEQGQLRLIEINTNASMSLVVDAMAQTRVAQGESSDIIGRDFRQDILRRFAQEVEMAGTSPTLKTVAIVDEHPKAQRLYVEFELYAELFRSNGWRVSIEDPEALRIEGSRLVGSEGPIDLVYNRDTDFYFENPRAAVLREAMERRLVTITPHPFEYRLLADKERLFELAQPGALESLPISADARAAIDATLIRTLDVDSVPRDDLWRDRKKLFFKPRRSFGGKAVYRGSAMSRGTFEEILKGHYLAQENIPAPKLLWTSPEGDELEFKYDLRFFSYRDRIQLACARLYRGQMTNSQTPHGGVAPVVWVD